MVTFYVDTELWGDALTAMGLPPCLSRTFCLSPEIREPPPLPEPDEDGNAPAPLPPSMGRLLVPGRYRVEIDVDPSWADILRGAGYEIG